MPVAFCPLNSPQKVCSVTSFLLRDVLIACANAPMGQIAFSVRFGSNDSGPPKGMTRDT